MRATDGVHDFRQTEDGRHLWKTAPAGGGLVPSLLEEGVVTESVIVEGSNQMPMKVDHVDRPGLETQLVPNTSLASHLDHSSANQ